MTLADPAQENLRLRREAASRELVDTGQRLIRLAHLIDLFEGDENADWPRHWPIPQDVSEAIAAATDAAHRVDVTITQARRDYRIAVLRWLLTETETEAAR